MKVLSRLVKVLSLLSLTLSILVNIGLGIVIFYIVRIVKYVKKIAELKTTGTRVMATVTGIDALNTHTYSFSGSLDLLSFLGTPMSLSPPGNILRQARPTRLGPR